MMKTKILAIESGGDWYDAQVDYLEMPADMDIDAMKEKYEVRDDRSLRFADWLMEQGCEVPDDDKLVVYRNE